VLKNIEENGDRLFAEDAKFNLHDYDNIIEIAFGNWVRPDVKSPKIWYRIFMMVSETENWGG
jgi:hypothetical protein